MKLLFSLFFVLLSGCSSTSFNSNADIYLENSIRKSVVDRYSNDEVWKLGAAQLGYVESNYCQVDYRDFKPTTESLISDLEVRTQKLGGNALVFDSCINSNTAGCNSHTQCRGIAYLIEYNK